MKKLGLTLFAIIFAVGLYSCDEPVESINRDPGDVSYLPMKIGDNWVFDRKIIDVDGSIINTEVKLLDSAVVRGLTIKNGINSKLITFYGDFINKFTNEIYRAPFQNYIFTPDGNNLLLSSDFLNKIVLEYIKIDTNEVQLRTFNMAFPIGEQWIPLVNARTGAETVMSKDSMVLRVELPSYDNPQKTEVYATYARGRGTVEVKPEGASTITSGGKSFNANKYSVTAKFEGNPIGEEGLIDKPFNMNYTVSFWFAEGIGFVRYRVEPISISTTIEGKEINYKQIGTESTLIRGTYSK